MATSALAGSRMTSRWWRPGSSRTRSTPRWPGSGGRTRRRRRWPCQAPQCNQSLRRWLKWPPWPPCRTLPQCQSPLPRCLWRIRRCGSRTRRSRVPTARRGGGKGAAAASLRQGRRPRRRPRRRPCSCLPRRSPARPSRTSLRDQPPRPRPVSTAVPTGQEHHDMRPGSTSRLLRPPRHRIKSRPTGGRRSAARSSVLCPAP
mmetsp:Transcript_70577/g.207011  ORF Transcript_70577/g.207011 Transcript_70577/m.207011 type:complete len:202 (-) Transcript_70577:191-796(-)